jgi:hypothetical protein
VWRRRNAIPPHPGSGFQNTSDRPVISSSLGARYSQRQRMACYNPNHDEAQAGLVVAGGACRAATADRRPRDDSGRQTLVLRGQVLLLARKPSDVIEQGRDAGLLPNGIGSPSPPAYSALHLFNFPGTGPRCCCGTVRFSFRLAPAIYPMFAQLGAGRSAGSFLDTSQRLHSSS